MISGSSIDEMNLQAAADALDSLPLPLELGDAARWKRAGSIRGVPFLGDYRPAGYELVEERTVGDWGLGDSSSTFLDWCQANENAGYYLGITSTGQWAVECGIFRKNAAEKGNRKAIEKKAPCCPDCGHLWESHSDEWGCTPNAGLAGSCDCQKYKAGNGRVSTARQYQPERVTKPKVKPTNANQPALDLE